MLCHVLALGLAWGAYFPVTHNAEETWQRPYMQPWDPLRALQGSIMVTWMPGWNPWCSVDRYELQVRRPRGPPMRFADMESLRYRETDIDEQEVETWPGDAQWDSWSTTYSGVGRAYTLYVEKNTAHAAQFRVRACGNPASLAGPGPTSVGCSAWSPVQTAYTVISAPQEKVNFMVRGMGMNAPDYTHIEVNRQVVYRRRDETGLVLAVFRRLDFSLQWLRTYDTHRNRSEALTMAEHIRFYNASYFIVVASTIAWEWQAPRTLVQTMEFCGAYHFSQWAYTFAEQIHYRSNTSDLQQSASQEQFGHPYAFIGIPGIGTAMGWESLMYNTGHYLARSVKPQQAIIRGVAYYDYVARLYRLQDVTATKAVFFLKGQPPLPETFHNPVPRRKIPALDFFTLASMEPAYTPYIGTLREHITKVLEANGTVMPYNFAFYLQTDAKVRKVDPRPRSWWVTELERVWGGPSMRYWNHNATILHQGEMFEHRSCPSFIKHMHLFADPLSCGPNFQDCCDKMDVPDFPVTECGVGVSPTLCANADAIQDPCPGPFELVNKTNFVKWPCEFRIIDWYS
ncbi:unnamed protein product [Effrenium voratum]|nr:unnamed protein product [Effrenium voratum]CAJ1428022.1 unnamed protein product [Effrenium voratum]